MSIHFIFPIFAACPLILTFLKEELSVEKLRIPLIDINVSKNLVIPILIFIGGIVCPYLLQALLSCLYRLLEKSLHKTKIKQSKIELYRKIPFLHQKKSHYQQYTTQQQTTQQTTKGSPYQPYTTQTQYRNQQTNWDKQAEYYKRLYEQEKQQRERQQEQSKVAQEPSLPDFFAGCDTMESRKKRYRELMKIYHPDNQNGNSEMLVKIQNAFQSCK